MMAIDTVKLKMLFLQSTCQKIFRHLDTVTDAEVQQLLRFAIMQHSAIVENTVNVLAGIPFVDKMPFASHNEAVFLAAVCYYRLGNLAEAANMLRPYKNLKGYDYAATLYLTARAQGAAHDETAQVLNKLCQPHIAQKVLDDFAEPDKVLTKVYPVCQNGKCNKCNIACNYKVIEDFYFKLAKLEQANTPGTVTLANILTK